MCCVIPCGVLLLLLLLLLLPLQWVVRECISIPSQVPQPFSCINTMDRKWSQ